MRDVVNIRYTFDERITDGFYTSTALERFRQYIEDPALLDETVTLPVGNGGIECQAPGDGRTQQAVAQERPAQRC